MHCVVGLSGTLRRGCKNGNKIASEVPPSFEDGYLVGFK